MLMALGFAVCSVAQADTFNYDDKNGVDVMFTDISEDTTSGEPLFGEPVVDGNALDFDPVNFSSESASGEAEILDSQLSFTVMTANPADSILKVNITERGDYRLEGLGEAQAFASVTAQVFWDILEINNEPVDTPMTGSGSLVFTPSGGSYNLADDGAGGAIWTGGLTLEVPAGSTKIAFTMDNTLSTAAINGGSAFIKKKDGDVIIEVIVPEPASATMSLMGLLGLAFFRRRR